jgi:deoxyribose-phosphate aldolase
MIIEQAAHIEDLLSKTEKINFDRTQLIRCITSLDLTSLNDDDDEMIIRAICEQAMTAVGHVASVCFYPKFISLAKSLLQITPVQVATVANFPTGLQNLATVMKDMQAALDLGVDEIDVVFPYQRYLQGERQACSDFIRRCAKEVAGQAKLKVILETGALIDLAIIAEATADAIAAGADFVKTSTGKIKVGATRSSVAAMLLSLQALQQTYPQVGLKVSGGVKTAVQALQYLRLADEIMGPDWATPKTFRFGASSLLLDLMRKL